MNTEYLKVTETETATETIERLRGLSLEMAVVETLDRDALTEKIRGIEAGTFVNLTTAVDVKMRKTGNPYFGQVTKISKRNFLAGSIYGTRVKNNIRKEGGNPEFFEVSSNIWWDHISNALCVHKKDNSKLYFQVEHFLEIPPIYTGYFLNGKSIDYSLIESFIPEKTGSKKQDEAGLERQVNFIMYALDSIVDISMYSQKYVMQYRIV